MSEGRGYTGCHGRARSKETDAATANEGSHIISLPGHCGGKPHIAGHRIKVQHVAYWHERHGKNPDEIIAEHPGLTLAEVYAALAYYRYHRQEIDADMLADEQFLTSFQGQGTSSRFAARITSGHARTIRFTSISCDPRIAAGLRQTRRECNHSRGGWVISVLPTKVIWLDALEAWSSLMIRTFCDCM